ncbi:energy transducer TonB [Chryseobacterium sp. FH1]|uniref:energy transducer TonB n=1 Tax=Chryseobacterium sp. FH1 TaxID=1233951 RepID=UPI000AF0D9F6|nr:energy transducer TonB [Chryseobacterium sp. FH1]
MKKLILLFGVLLSIFAYSQSEEKNAIEEKAYFPKGNQVFRTMISKNIRTDKIVSNGNQNIHCELTFVIDREGNITDVKAFGDNKEFNDEAVNAISQIKEKWIPGKINGVAVRSRYKVPLDMKFENDTQPTYFRSNEGFIQGVKEKISFKKIKEKENMFCEISFVVETNGKISNINVTGDNESLNKEVIRAVSKIKGRWNPAIINGAVVSQVFKLPLEINVIR